MGRDYTIKKLPQSSKSGIDYAKELNEKQLAAVTAPPGPALVIAGAGSGKTRTLTYRVAYLLDNGIPPGNILLLTFTNKASHEMLSRVEQLVPCDTRKIWGGTFHSLGNRLLRLHADRLGWTSNFSILDRDDQKEVLKTVIAESGMDTKAARFPKPELMANIFSLSRNTASSISDLIEKRHPYFSHLTHSIESLLVAYENKKKETNSMDFDDLLEKTLLLFHQHPEIREHYQRQFEWVLVDEYQDTNSIQAELIALLAAPQNNLMVVGDDAQSIYSWRGADFRNILEFPEQYQDARQFVIETNYRSVPEILTLANAAIAPNTEQFHKNLAPARGQRNTLPALASLQNPNEQAAFVAQRILELRDEGVELEEMAVLYRAHYHSMEIQMELTKRGIPFFITSGLRFFEQAHIKDAAAFMKFACNRKDEIAFNRMALMLPGIGAKSASRLWREWLQCPGSRDENNEPFSTCLLDFPVPARAKSSREQLVYTLDELLDNEGQPKPPGEMMPSILGGVYEDIMMSKFTNVDARTQDLQQFQKYAEKFDNLEEFLSQLCLLAGQDAVGATRSQADQEAVCLSSIHQAKGLEWKVVFLVWLADGMFPNNRVLDEDDAEKSGLEEERRLFYVALTRAKDDIYLTYPIYWPGSFKGDVLQSPSRFLEAVSSELMEEWNVGSSW